MSKVVPVCRGCYLIPVGKGSIYCASCLTEKRLLEEPITGKMPDMGGCRNKEVRAEKKL